MKAFLRHLIIHNWPRKGISLALALIIWLVVDQSLTSTKTINNIPIRIIHIPEGKTVEGIQSNSFLTKKLSLTLTGKKTFLEELGSNDLEVVIDASGQKDEFIATIGKQNISSLNPNLNIAQDISKINAKSFIVRMTKLSRERIPIFITPPIGEPPKGYQFLDTWPYQLYLTVSGPEKVVKDLKSRGLKLTFNLNDISKSELDNLQSQSSHIRNDVVSFYVPAEWKQIYLPSISESPLVIDDPDAKYLRIDFVRSELAFVSHELPVYIFIPPKTNNMFSIDKLSILKSPLLSKQKGQIVFTKKLFAKGVSDLFVEIVKDRLMLIVIYDSDSNKPLSWSVEFVEPKILEDHYIAMLMSDSSNEDLRDLQPSLRQDYLRNRFRNYMNRFQPFTEGDKLLDLNIQIRDNQLSFEENKTP